MPIKEAHDKRMRFFREHGFPPRKWPKPRGAPRGPKSLLASLHDDAPWDSNAASGPGEVATDALSCGCVTRTVDIMRRASLPNSVRRMASR